MQSATRNMLDVFQNHPTPVTTHHALPGLPRRAEAENFIREVFSRRYGAQITAFAPRLLLLEQDGRVIAATGWRAAGDTALFLERYLDLPIENAMAALADQPVARDRIVEVGNLAAEKTAAPSMSFSSLPTFSMISVTNGWCSPPPAS